MASTMRAMATLRAGYTALAIKLQESDLSANDIAARLRDCIADCYRGTGQWAYYVDHFGDGASGDVIYSCEGDMCRTSYEITDDGGAAKCVIDFEGAKDVVPRTIYEEEMDEADHMAAMESAYKADGFTLPVYERFISKKERDAASGDDFAGKGRSFPILKPEDVMAAARSLGRAGTDNKGTTAIKSAIIRIAKRKGWGKYLPKAWQETSSTESAAPESAGTLQLVESFNFAEAETLQLTESATGTIRREIKVIAPGRGSSAIYPEEVLKRDGPAVFKDKTQIYINHATRAEESERPEGDWHKLVGALAGNAYWKEDGRWGKGVYAMADFAADVAPSIFAKAPWSGMSIRANGNALTEGGRPILQNGLPVLKEFTACESIDVVTRAGAGGMILTEAAKPGETKEKDGMTEAEAKVLIEAAVSSATAPLVRRLRESDAREEGKRLLESVTGLPEVAKTRIIERAVKSMGDEFVVDKFREMVVAESKAEGEYIAALNGGAGVRGMGVAAPVAVPKPEEIAAREAQRQAQEADDIALYESLGMTKKGAGLAAKGRAA